MELLPIIYTTLLIFAGIAFVTIIGSFISFKVRKKNGWLEQEEATDILETPDIIKKRLQNNSTPPKDQNSKKQKHHSERNSNNTSQNNSSREENRRKKPSSRDRNRENERYLEEKRISEKKKELAEREKELAEKEKIRSKDRIQVLNNLNSSKPSNNSDSDFSKPSMKNKKYNTLGDDIMKNYADNKEDAFNPLKTKSKKS